MALMRNFANQYVGTATAATSSTDSAFAFPFNANFVRIVNDKAARIYVDLSSTGTTAGRGTTNGLVTCASEILDIPNVLVAGLALASTTTTTGTLVRVSAIGA
jgi:hypothetical protein